MEYNEYNVLESGEQDSSFGIKKIIDCKIANGQQMYKVQWEPTWEPAINLQGFPDLIDDFWSLINNAKIKENTAQEFAKNARMRTLMNDKSTSIMKLSSDDKTEIHNLIARTNNTSVSSLRTPSDLLSTPGNYQSNLTLLNNKGGLVDQNTSGVKRKNETLVDNKVSVPKPPKNTDSSTVSNTASLKYLENFSNPYVKVIIVCKMCNKEASKNSSQWKVHYLTHVSKEDRPFKCEVCNQGFVQKIHLQKHMKKHTKPEPKSGTPNEQAFMNYGNNYGNFMNMNMKTE